MSSSASTTDSSSPSVPAYSLDPESDALYLLCHTSPLPLSDFSYWRTRWEELEILHFDINHKDIANLLIRNFDKLFENSPSKTGNFSSLLRYVSGEMKGFRSDKEKQRKVQNAMGYLSNQLPIIRLILHYAMESSGNSSSEVRSVDRFWFESVDRQENQSKEEQERSLLNSPLYCYLEEVVHSLLTGPQEIRLELLSLLITFVHPLIWTPGEFHHLSFIPLRTVLNIINKEENKSQTTEKQSQSHLCDSLFHRLLSLFVDPRLPDNYPQCFEQAPRNHSSLLNPINLLWKTKDALTSLTKSIASLALAAPIAIFQYFFPFEKQFPASDRAILLLLALVYLPDDPVLFSPPFASSIEVGNNQNSSLNRFFVHFSTFSNHENLYDSLYYASLLSIQSRDFIDFFLFSLCNLNPSYRAFLLTPRSQSSIDSQHPSDTRLENLFIELLIKIKSKRDLHFYSTFTNLYLILLLSQSDFYSTRMVTSFADPNRHGRTNSFLRSKRTQFIQDIGSEFAWRPQQLIHQFTNPQQFLLLLSLYLLQWNWNVGIRLHQRQFSTTTPPHFDLLFQVLNNSLVGTEKKFQLNSLLLSQISLFIQSAGQEYLDCDAILINFHEPAPVSPSSTPGDNTAELLNPANQLKYERQLNLLRSVLESVLSLLAFALISDNSPLNSSMIQQEFHSKSPAYAMLEKISKCFSVNPESSQALAPEAFKQFNLSLIPLLLTCLNDHSTPFPVNYPQKLGKYSSPHFTQRCSTSFRLCTTLFFLQRNRFVQDTIQDGEKMADFNQLFEWSAMEFESSAFLQTEEEREKEIQNLQEKEMVRIPSSIPNVPYCINELLEMDEEEERGKLLNSAMKRRGKPKLEALKGVNIN